MSETEIIDKIRSHFASGCLYHCANIFAFGSWECDFFIQKYQSRICTEFEVKISRNDFFADRKKVDKHQILEHGLITVDGVNHPVKYRPNKFFYVVPDKLIAPNETPKYAGLIYVTSGHGLEIIKNAPMLHKEKLEMEGMLCRKFFDRIVSLRHKNLNLKWDLQDLRRAYNDLLTEYEKLINERLINEHEKQIQKS